MQRLTLDELEALPVDSLTPAQVAPVLCLDQDTIRGQARSCPELLGFPVVVAGRQVRIPKPAFIKFMREGIKDDASAM